MSVKKIIRKILIKIWLIDLKTQTDFIIKTTRMIKKCLKNKNEDFDKDLINRFANTYRFCNKDYTHAQKVFEELKIKNLDDYHDFNVQSDTLLVADVIENFRNKCIEIYELDSAHFLSAPGLA